MAMSIDIVAENSWLKLIGRAAMALSIPMFMWILGYISGLSTTVNTNVIKIEGLSTAVNKLDGSLSNLDQRTVLILQSVARLEAGQQRAANSQ